MPIDWTTRERALSLAYLIEGTYHDENGVKRLVHWCGPKARVGSGLSVPVPIYAGQRGALTPVWEARVTRASMDMNMGNLDQTISAISDLTFNVDISGGSQASAPPAGDLRRDIVFGRWRNKECRVWVLDLDTLDTQIMGKGAFDRNPSSIGPGLFQITVDISPIFPANLDWPQGRIPLNTNGFTFDSAGQIQHIFIPDIYMLNPDQAGKYTGVVFGDGGIAGADYVWKELIPYGRQIYTTSPVRWRVFAWVSPQKNCFVEEVYFENADANMAVTKVTAGLETFENDDPAKGPLGTCVRFTVTDALVPTQSFDWWSGIGCRAVARVTGPVSGQHDYFQYSEVVGGNPVSVYARTGPVRSQVWTVISDAITDPSMMNLTGVLGTGAIADFQNTVPTMSPATDTPFFAALACVVPREITDRPITAREAFGSLAQFFPFDFAQRYDPATEDWRVYPVWRSAFTTPPAYVFGVEDMSKTDPPAITQYDNPDGSYANNVVVTTPGYYGVPTPSATSPTPELLPIKKEKFQHVDVFEQTAALEADEVVASLEMKHWLHYGFVGNGAAAWTIGEERSQPQRTVQATHGVRSFRVEMGTAIQYEMVGINSDVGMVRKMRYDFDLQQVQITSYHIDHSTRRTTQHGDNIANNHGPDTDVPDPD